MPNWAVARGMGRRSLRGSGTFQSFPGSVSDPEQVKEGGLPEDSPGHCQMAFSCGLLTPGVGMRMGDIRGGKERVNSSLGRAEIPYVAFER